MRFVGPPTLRLQHGFAKLSRGPDAFVAILQTVGVPAPHVMAWLTSPSMG
jgi:hypothetical protein